MSLDEFIQFLLKNEEYIESVVIKDTSSGKRFLVTQAPEPEAALDEEFYYQDPEDR